MSRIPGIVAGLRHSFRQGVTRPATWRIAQLRRLRAILVSRGAEFERALQADLGKHPTEAHLTELGVLIAEIDHALTHLHRWMRPRRAAVPLALQPARARLVPEPLGVVLVIAPWNYPVLLTLSPLIGALAAGNAVVVKPSEHAPHTAALLAQALETGLDRRAVAVVNGGVPETTTLLAERFDHVFFTGNAVVGSVVAQAAAVHCTPVTLELGGKSPAFVDESCDLNIAAKRIAWGAFMNAGQTCVAPDYVLATPEVAERLVVALERAIDALYGAAPLRNPDLGRIVNEAHFDRLYGLLGSGRCVIGGEHSRRDLKIAPTVLVDVPRDSPIMHEEIFGPLLPIVTVTDLDDALDMVRAGGRPLAAYVFSESQYVRDAWECETSSGALVFGAPIIQLVASELPFGGVGESGYGSYHGERSFSCFSHDKPVLEKPSWPETLGWAVMPPYTKRRDALIRRVLDRLRG